MDGYDSSSNVSIDIFEVSFFVYFSLFCKKNISLSILIVGILWDA